MPKSKRAPVPSGRAARTAPPTEISIPGGSPGLLLVYSATVFLSAFLLFQVEPLIGKYILPWFGGTPAVWTTCLLVFQVLLFGGYLYAHLTSRWLGPRSQAALHTTILVAACLMLPIIPGEALKPSGIEEPTRAIVWLLAVTIGLPFFALSATGPLLQAWQGQTHAARTPYRLYALSNAASLLALVSFPALFEWLFATSLLAKIWSWAFGAFALLCAGCAWGMAYGSRAASAEPAVTSRRDLPAVPWGTRFLWFALAMVPSVLLLATTNQVCLDVASVPFLWVLPLTLYLLSFILCFESDRWYSRRFVMPATAIALGCLYPVMASGNIVPLWLQILMFFAAFFLSAMVCHGELSRRRPHPQHLTAYYLVIAAGGAAGGIFVGVLAPFLFSGYYELHLGLFAVVVLMLVVLYTDPASRFARARPSWAWVVFLLAAGLFAAMLFDNSQDAGGYRIPDAGCSAGQSQAVVEARDRTFYGILRVTSREAMYYDQIRATKILVNGRTMHGLEYEDPDLRSVPTLYYDELSGLGRLLSHRDANKPCRVGAVGLGIGTVAAYGRAGDTFRFYEINDHVEPIARKYFHFLDGCKGKVEIVTGDGRLSLEREPSPQNFDVLILDAFSSDSIPTHLLTREAFAVYLRHLAPDGILAAHISNMHFNLQPVVEGAAAAHGLSTVTVESSENTFGGLGSVWVLISPAPEALAAPWIRQVASPVSPRTVLWTDDHASLLPVWLGW